MKQNKLTIFAILSVLCVGILLFFAMSRTPKRFSWFENYRAESDQPYGTRVIRELLQGYRSDGEFTLNSKMPVRNLLKDVDRPDRTDYIFIGQSIFLDPGSTKALAKFMEDGGNAFIASLEPPAELLDAVYYRECDVPLAYEYQSLESAEMNFYHGKLRDEKGYKFRYRLGAKDSSYPWRYIGDSAFCDSTSWVVPVGFYNDKRVNFIRIPVGRGSLFLHSNPLVFTNYFLTDRRKASYVSAVFSHLDGEDILWDEFSKVPMSGSAYNSPLYYLLAQPSLKYAWWMLLSTVLVYAVFAARRKQRVIPVREPKINTSLEFANIIARLHYKNGNHLDMAHKKMKYFLYFVRSKYGIHAERFGDEQMRRLAGKARVDFADVQVIFSRYYLIEERFKNNIEASRLLDLCDSIDNFYKASKRP